jgi:hypothetical protein
VSGVTVAHVTHAVGIYTVLLELTDDLDTLLKRYQVADSKNNASHTAALRGSLDDLVDDTSLLVATLRGLSGQSPSLAPQAGDTEAEPSIDVTALLTLISRRLRDSLQTLATSADMVSEEMAHPSRRDQLQRLVAGIHQQTLGLQVFAENALVPPPQPAHTTDPMSLPI